MLNIETKESLINLVDKIPSNIKTPNGDKLLDYFILMYNFFFKITKDITLQALRQNKRFNDRNKFENDIFTSTMTIIQDIIINIKSGITVDNAKILASESFDNLIQKIITQATLVNNIKLQEEIEISVIQLPLILPSLSTEITNIQPNELKQNTISKVEPYIRELIKSNQQKNQLKISQLKILLLREASEEACQLALRSGVLYQNAQQVVHKLIQILDKIDNDNINIINKGNNLSELQINEMISTTTNVFSNLQLFTLSDANQIESQWAQQTLDNSLQALQQSKVAQVQLAYTLTQSSLEAQRQLAQASHVVQLRLADALAEAQEVLSQQALAEAQAYALAKA
jgi:hypothetical protein